MPEILLGGLLPLLMTPGLFFHYDTTPKLLLLEAVAAFLLLRPGLADNSLTQLWSRPSGRWLVLIATAQIAWFAVATVASTRPWFSLFGSAWRQFGLVAVAALLIAVVLIGGDGTRWRPLLRAITVAALVQSAYGILQYFDIDPFQNSALYHDHAGDSVIVRPPGTMGHADYLGWWLASAFFCGLAVWKGEKGAWRNAGIAAAALAGAATVLSGTRAAAVALAAGLAFLASSRGLRITRQSLGIAAVCLVLAGLFVLSPAGTRVRARMSWSVEEPLGAARPLIWRDSLRMSLAKPLTGFGPETFPEEFLRWQSEDLAHIYPDVHQESPHNLVLDMMTGEGVPGLLLAIAWVWLGINAARKAGQEQAPLAAALVAGGVASLFTAATLAPIILSLLILAMLVSSTQPEPGLARHFGRLTTFGIPLAVLLLIHAGIVAISDFRLAKFQRSPDVTLYQRLREVRLPGAGEDLFCSRALANACRKESGNVAQMQCFSVALEAAATATRTADDPANAWYNLAAFAAMRNDAGAIDSSLRNAIGLAPNWFKPHWTRAMLLRQTGDDRGALSEARAAASLDHGHHLEVAQTAAEIARGAR